MRPLMVTKPWGTALAIAAVFTGVGLTWGGGQASAEPVFHFKCQEITATKEYEAVAYDQDDHYVGLALWDSDGDKLQATDPYADGWGVIAHLSTGRVASTRGHSAPYISPWVTGDLPENHAYTMWIEMVRGNAGTISQTCPARS